MWTGARIWKWILGPLYVSRIPHPVKQRVRFTPSRELFPFRSRWFESAVGPVHYIDEGVGSPILFLHGNPTWSFVYRSIISRLRTDFRCVALDYPGFGLSVHPDDYGYTPGEHAAVATALVAHLDLQDVLVMGQDWGGSIGVSVALAAPERIRGFIVGNSWHRPVTRWFNRGFARLLATRPMQRRLLEHNLFVERLMPMGLARPLAPEVFEHYRAVQPAAGFRRGAAEFPRQLIDARCWLGELAARAPHVLGRKAALLVWGMKDRGFPPVTFSHNGASCFRATCSCHSRARATISKKMRRHRSSKVSVGPSSTRPS